METNKDLILGYRVIFPDAPSEDYPDVDSAWARREEYITKTRKIPYVRPIRPTDPEFRSKG